MNMWIQFNAIQAFVTEHGRLPEHLDEVSDRPEGIQYTRLAGDVFKLIGRNGNVIVDFTST